MKVSVVIPHLRGSKILLDVLGDLEKEKNEFPEMEVILVDNKSADGSVFKAQKAFPWVKVLHLKENRGYAGGCNAGIRKARGEWIWLLNDDVRFDTGVVGQLVEAGESDLNIAAVQPKIRSYQKPELFDYAGGAGGYMDMFGYPFTLGRLGGDIEKDDGQYDGQRDIFWASGTACLWRRNALIGTGLLDSSFFAHMEEIDLAWRAWLRGWRIISEPDAVIFHLGGGTLSYQAFRKMFLNHRNNLIMISKNVELNRLVWLLPIRLVMDLGIGIIDVGSGSPRRLFAIITAWIAYFISLKSTLKKRCNIQQNRIRRDRDLRKVIWPGSILVSYALGKRNASQLAKLVS